MVKQQSYYTANNNPYDTGYAGNSWQFITLGTVGVPTQNYMPLPNVYMLFGLFTSAFTSTDNPFKF